jgi:hypothetical protein
MNVSCFSGEGLQKAPLLIDMQQYKRGYRDEDEVILLPETGPKCEVHFQGYLTVRIVIPQSGLSET